MSHGRPPSSRTSPASRGSQGCRHWCRAREACRRRRCGAVAPSRATPKHLRQRRLAGALVALSCDHYHRERHRGGARHRQAEPVRGARTEPSPAPPPARSTDSRSDCKCGRWTPPRRRGAGARARGPGARSLWRVRRPRSAVAASRSAWSAGGRRRGHTAPFWRRHRLGLLMASAAAVALAVVVIATQATRAPASRRWRRRPGSPAPPRRRHAPSAARLPSSTPVSGSFVDFPDSQAKFGWRAVGRRDSPAGTSLTVIYRNDQGARMGYAVVSGDTLGAAPPGRRVTRNGKTYHVASVGGRGLTVTGTSRAIRACSWRRRRSRTRACRDRRLANV